MRADVKDAIERAAKEAGIDPAYALAVADRESSGDPMAHSSKTIGGIYQMTGALRQRYGAQDSKDPYTQAKAWTSYIKDVKGEMGRVLGREPTDQEAYLGHHFGGVRAARMLKGDPNTNVDEVFTPYERSLNPHFDKAGTVGQLNSSVMADIAKRQASYGAAGSNLLPEPVVNSGTSTVAENGSGLTSPRDGGGPDLSSFGKPVQDGTATQAQNDAPSKPVDMSAFNAALSPPVPPLLQPPRAAPVLPPTQIPGIAAIPSMPTTPGAPSAAPDLSSYGRAV